MIMKKEYISPNLEEIEFKLSNILSGSVNNTSETEVEEGSSGSTINLAPGMESGSDDLDW